LRTFGQVAELRAKDKAKSDASEAKVQALEAFEARVAAAREAKAAK